MQRHQPTLGSQNPAQMAKWRLICSITLAFAFSIANAPVAKAAEVGIGAEDAQWKLVVSGVFSVYVSSIHFSEGGKFGVATGPDNENESGFRVRSGFNPTQLDFIMIAPPNDTADVAVHVKFATSQQGSGASFVGNTIETRILEIRMSGKAGQLSIGKGLNLFERTGTLNDMASMFGIGYQPSPDTAGPGFGHIGTGYTWVDFSASVRYKTPSKKGFNFEFGIFDPYESAFGVFAGGNIFEAVFGGTLADALGVTSPAGTAQSTPFETPAPRIEGEMTYGTSFGDSGSVLLWLGGLYQYLKTNDAIDETLHNFGANAGLVLGGKGVRVRGNVSYTAGAGAASFFGNGLNGNVCFANGACEAVLMLQAYGAADYTIKGKTTIGGSFGWGRQFDEPTVGILEKDNLLVMGYIHYNILPFQWIVFEYAYLNAAHLNTVLPDGMGGIVSIPFDQKYHSFSLGTILMF